MRGKSTVGFINPPRFKELNSIKYVTGFRFPKVNQKIFRRASESTPDEMGVNTAIFYNIHIKRKAKVLL